MRYSPKQYAVALLMAFDDRPAADHKKILRQFISTVSKRGDSSRLRPITREVEKQYLRKAGLRKVLLESVGPVPAKVKREIEEVLGKKIIIQEKINPAILAGIKIIINDELLIDASAQTQIKNLFSS